ncbi:MAG: DUF4174 domain-containing protein [Phycisphaerae bacterium]
MYNRQSARHSDGDDRDPDRSDSGVFGELLVSAAHCRDRDFLAQQQHLVDCQAVLDQNGLDVIYLFDTIPDYQDARTADEAFVHSLRRRYRIPPARFTLVLAGPLGNEKFRSDRPVSGPELAGLIEAMSR